MYNFDLKDNVYTHFFIRTMVLNEKTLKFPKKLRTQHSQKIDRWFLF